jgi:hypothetical protein
MRSRRWKNSFLCPFPGSAADAIDVYYPVALVHLAHVFTAVFHYHRLYSISMLMTKFTFCWKTVHVHQQMHISSVFAN